ncbi:MAG: aldo/keto reductase [Trueperaceae bacterium]|nr:aldo/keto reductase [Trueperaceae bacterium]
MEYTRFGKTDLHVSKVCFGTWQQGGDWGSFEVEQAQAAMRRALELGINFFDTAQAYGFGKAEQILGEALKDEIKERRDELVLATKGGLRMEDGELLRDSSPEWLRKGVEDSLRFLGTDYIDLYQIHWPDSDRPFEEMAEVLDGFVKEGLIRYVGVSNYDEKQMAAFEKGRKLDALQPPYHLFRREVEERILPYAYEHDVGVLVYGPLAHGLLTGKYDPDEEFSEDDWRSQSDIFQGETFRRNLAVVDKLDAFAAERGYDVTQLAVAWVLANPAVDVAIVGARKPAHIEGTAPASDIHLTDGDLQEIEEIMNEAKMVGGPSPEGV